MTFHQLEKMNDLHAAGWDSVPDPNFKAGDEMICGGPLFMKNPDGVLHQVHSDGTVMEYKNESA